jgi:hypothetical protein
MKIQFQRTYAEFSENYLATHYSGGVNSLTRLLGGPAIMVGSALLFVFLNPRIENAFFRGLILVLTIIAVLFGLFRTLAPLLNLFLVWLRRDSLFSNNQSQVEIELDREVLNITEGEESYELDVHKILSIQHRTASTWLLTEGDVLISIPREGVTMGDHEALIAALEEILFQEEEE